MANECYPYIHNNIPFVGKNKDIFAEKGVNKPKLIFQDREGHIRSGYYDEIKPGDKPLRWKSDHSQNLLKYSMGKNFLQKIKEKFAA